MSKLAGKRKGIVSMLLTALMVCALAVPGAVAADSPSNDPIEVPGIAAADSGPVNSSYRSDPPSPPPPLPPPPHPYREPDAYAQPQAGEQGGVEPQHRWEHRRVYLEPDSDGQDGRDSHGDAYYVHRDIGAPSHVAGRADTEADAQINPPVSHTKVYVWVWLYFWDGQKWVLKASDWNWTDQQCPWYLGQTHEYDADVVVRAPLQTGWWCTSTWHRVYRDGVLTASKGQTTPPQWIWWGSIPQGETGVAP